MYTGKVGIRKTKWFTGSLIIWMEPFVSIKEMLDSLIAYFGLASEYVNLFPVSVKELKKKKKKKTKSYYDGEKYIFEMRTKPIHHRKRLESECHSWFLSWDMNSTNMYLVLKYNIMRNKINIFSRSMKYFYNVLNKTSKLRL